MQTFWDLRGQHGTLWEAPGTNLDDVLAQIGIPGTLPPPILSQDSQDMCRRVAACNDIVDQATDAIAGYYTLSAADLPLTELPPDLTKRLPRYPTLPAARLGRLAVDQRYLGQKLGALLLADAVMRAAASEAAV